MAAIKASVNVFALLDGDDPGDKRLADLDPKHKDQPKMKPLSAAACDYKLKLMKPPAPAAAGSKAPRRNPTPAVAAGLRSTAAAHLARAMHKQTTTPALAPARSTNLAGLRSTAAAAASPANKKATTQTLPARSTNYTALLFAKAYPSAREQIFKQRQERQEEWERRQAEAAENGGAHGKTAAAEPAGAPKERHGKGQKEEAPAPAPARTVPVVVKSSPLPPPPKLEDIDQFPSLK